MVLLEGFQRALLAVFFLRHGACEPLLLTPLLKSGKLEEAREASKVVIDGRTMGHSGFFAVPSESGQRVNQLFTWFQPCLDGCNAGTAPFIQWFNGGPGSPDTTGAMNQIGNWYVDAELGLHERCFSWCRHNNCLFIDNPTMTGFSYQVNQSRDEKKENIEYTRTSMGAAKQVLEVLLQFLQIWPEYADAPYYVHGLSYGGNYVPSMARTVLDHNKADRQQINIKGMAAGDPCMNNKYQFPTAGATLYAMGLVTEEERATVDSLMANASALNDVDCVKAFQEWNKLWNDDGGWSCEPHCQFLFKAFTGSSNTEHMLLGAQPDNFAYFRKFLVLHASEFHAEGVSMHSSFEKVYFAMVESGDFCNPSAPLYTSLFLNEGLDVIVYSANLDPLLGPPTAAAGVQAAWDFAEREISAGVEAKRAYYSQRKSIWRVDAADVNPAGYARCLTVKDSRFCNIVVRNAGHEAAPYAPRSAYDLNERFIHRSPFNGEARSTGPAVPQCAACGGAPPLAGSALAECRSQVILDL